MKTKLQETADEQSDESGHAVNRPKAEHKEKVKGDSAAAEKVKQLIDNLEPDALKVTWIVENPEMNALDEALRIDWNASGLSNLVDDPKFMKQLERICRSLTSKFQTSPSYSWEDLRQDVITHLVKAIPRYHNECISLPLLRTVAKNQLIDVHRKPDNKCFSMEGTKLQGRNGEEYELDGEEHEGGELADRYGKTHRNHEEDRRFRSIRLDELMGALSAKERWLCFKYYIEGWTMEKIADALGVKRQAVFNQLGRALKKLRKNSH